MEVIRVKQKAQRPLVFLQEKFKKETGQELPRWVVKSLIKKYGFQRVIGHLKEINLSNKKNPIGYLTEAIKNNWQIWREPDYLKRYRIKKAKELKEAEKFRAAQGEYTDPYLRQLERDNEQRRKIEWQKATLLKNT